MTINHFSRSPVNNPDSTPIGTQRRQQLHQARQFQTFRALQSSMENFEIQQTRQNQALTVDSELFSPEHNLSSKRILGLFGAGFTAALAGRVALKNLFKQGKTQGKAAQQGKEFMTADIMSSAKNKTNELNIAQSFSNPLSSIYMLALFDPQQRSALMGYIAASVLGYVSASLAQGTQETWVRREETKIRARLIDTIQDSFKNSYKKKQHFDNKLKNFAQKEIYRLLLKHNVDDPHGIATDQPLIESNFINRQYHYEPTHRTIQFGNGDFNKSLNRFIESNQEKNYSTSKHALGGSGLFSGLSKQWKETGIFGLGAMAGLGISGFFSLFTTNNAQAQFGDKIINYKTIHVKDLESWWIMATKSRKNAVIFSGFALMAALGKLGKLVIDGIREIEVTRVNARTEQMYQQHNWLQLDPAFHSISEVEALRNELHLLDKELTYLKNSPEKLKARVTTILTNIGRNSAPKYFPMTPGVNLVEARG